MSTDYSKMSDFEINLLVARIILKGNIISERERTLTSSVFYENHQGIKTFDPCNNPADAWPIIVENRIRINPILYTKWMAEDYLEDVSSCHENPLRAAMIVFLMMQDEKDG